MSRINYEDFHNYIMWGQEQNKKNPGKFGTSEIYSYLMRGIKLEILEMKEKGNKGNDILEYLTDLIKIEENEMYNHL